MKKKARLCDPPLEEYNVDDFISRLPLEILVSIVSILTLKEATTTSILSRRWRNLELWKFVTTLDFKSDASLRAVLDLRSRSIERNKYINWVNRIVRHHKGLTLDAFMISFDLDKTSKAAIDNWIKFAVTKKVKRLELDFLKYENGIWFFREFMRSYTFPFKLFSGRQSNMAMCTGLRNLRVLSLRCVNVSDRVVEYLLLNCHLLEFLSVHGSDDLVNVKVIGQSLKLNSLEIGSCLGLKTVEIRNTNLASFLYFAPWVRFSIKNFQKPNEVSVGMDGPGVENIEFSKGERNEIILKIEDGFMKLSFNFPR